jgi:hypothetical protein
LPRLNESSSAPNGWDLIEGFNAEVLQGSAVVSGQHILRLVAVGADRRHALGVRFDNLAPGGMYRATAWVKAEPGVRVMIEARDSFDPHTRKPVNYGVARFQTSVTGKLHKLHALLRRNANLEAGVICHAPQGSSYTNRTTPQRRRRMPIKEEPMTSQKPTTPPAGRD